MNGAPLTPPACMEEAEKYVNNKASNVSEEFHNSEGEECPSQVATSSRRKRLVKFV